MYLREHRFKTNSLQRKQSPLDRHKVSMSNIWTQKVSYLCYESYAPAIHYCRCYSWCSLKSLRDFRDWVCEVCRYFSPFQAHWTLKGDGNAGGGVRWWSDKNCFRVKHQGWKGVVCAFGGSVASRRLCHTVPFSCLGLWVVVRAGVLREGAKVQRKPASSVRPRPPQAQNMDQP